MLMAQQVMTVRSENEPYQGKITITDPSITLIENLSSYVVKDTSIIEFFKEFEASQMSQNFIIPISCKQSGDVYNIIYHRFGTPLSELNQYSIQDLVNAEFIRQFSMIYYKLKDLRPIISLDNIFIMEKQPFKLLLKNCCQNSIQYMEMYQNIVDKLCINKKQIMEKTKTIKNIQDLKQLYSQPKEGKELSKILQLKFNFKLQPYKIIIEQVDLDWMFNTFGFKDHPKYELIYNGIQHNFDPIPHLKAISKQHVFYLIQAVNGNKIGFYTGIRYEWNNNALFGGYQVDKQKKSVIVGFSKHSVHQIEEEQFAVGYGSEILMAIGKVDIVFSAFNAQNLSYFPVSYKIDEKAGASKARHLLGDRCTLKQFEVYKII